jgi:hypothetical protein
MLGIMLLARQKERIQLLPLGPQGFYQATEAEV